jgi:hypothetical protein
LGEPRIRHHSKASISTLRLQPSSLLWIYAVNPIDAPTTSMELSQCHRCYVCRMEEPITRPHRETFRRSSRSEHMPTCLRNLQRTPVGSPDAHASIRQ